MCSSLGARIKCFGRQNWDIHRYAWDGRQGSITVWRWRAKSYVRALYQDQRYVANSEIGLHTRRFRWRHSAHAPNFLTSAVCLLSPGEKCLRTRVEILTILELKVICPWTDGLFCLFCSWAIPFCGCFVLLSLRRGSSRSGSTRVGGLREGGSLGRFHGFWLCGIMSHGLALTKPTRAVSYYLCPTSTSWFLCSLGLKYGKPAEN